MHFILCFDMFTDLDVDELDQLLGDGLYLL